jgi:hypothetical protein
MWLVTTRGFVSAVEWRGGEQDGKLVLRSRVRDHLDAVLMLAPEDTATAVAISPSSDYRYRAWITRDGFEKLLVALAREVTYPNFKDAVLARHGLSKYEAATHAVWSIFGRLQPRGPYGSGGSGFPAAPKGEAAEARRFAREQLPTRRRSDTHAKCCADCGTAEGPFVTVDGDPYCEDVGSCLARGRRD